MSAAVVLVTGAMGFAGPARMPARGGQGLIAPSAPRAPLDVDPRAALLHDRAPLEAHVAELVAPSREYLGQEVRREDSAACAVLDGCGVRRSSVDTSAVGRLDGLALAPATVQAGAAVVAATGSG